MKNKVKEFQDTKSGYFTGVKGFFGYGKSSEEEEQEKLQIMEFEKKLEIETKDKLHKQEAALTREITTLKNKKKIEQD